MKRFLPVVFVPLLLLLSGCRMTVRMATHVDASGGGSFTLAMEFDRELLEQLTAADAEGGRGRGLSVIESLFEGLAVKKWTVTRGAPDGGLLLEATRTFTDRSGFDAALAELRSARAADRNPLGGITLAIGYKFDRSLLRTHAEFTGDEETLKAVQDLVHFEIVADLPGVVTVTSGDGIAGESRVVWRPAIGTRTQFGANSSAVRVGPLLGVLIQSLLLVAGLSWVAFGRRRKNLEQLAITLDDPEAPNSGDR